VLFTDLVGSTALRGRFGDTAVEELRREHDRLLGGAVGDVSGRVVKGTGDGVMAVFDSAADALDAAVAIQQAIHDFNRRELFPEPVAVRIGVSAGDITREEGDCFGSPVIEAARLVDEASAGQILCAEAVRWLARGRADLSFRVVGELELKGLAEPVRTVELTWEPRVDAVTAVPAWADLAGGARFVGRDAELDRLRKCWLDAETGIEQFVALSGEPGIGKTRLAVEFINEVADRRGLVLAGRCDEDLAAPYQPFAEVLRQLVDAEGAALRGRLGQFPGELVRLAPSLLDHIPGLPSPVGSDSDTERWRLFDAVASWLRALSRERPVLLLLDDLHWASRPTLQLLSHVLRHGSGDRLMVLATYRDTELRRTHPLAEALADLRLRVGVERVALKGLSEDQVVDLLSTQAGHDIGDQGRQLAKVIWDETSGSPFFVGEVVRNLAESGRIYEVEGRWELDGNVTTLGIPEGVREVIGRRISRLSTPANEALTVASVIGAVFDRAVVEAAGGGSGEELEEALDEAVEAAVLEELAGHPGGYRFAHTLVRSTLYEELRVARRVRLHARVAEAIETVFRHRLDDRLPDLAVHYAAAAPAGFADKAIEYAMRAADRAARVGAYDEVARFCELGMDTAELSGNDAAACDLLIAAGTARLRSGVPLKAREDFERAAELADELGDAERLSRAALGAGGRGIRLIWSEVGRVEPRLIELLERARTALSEEDSALRAEVLGMLARELSFDAKSFDRRRMLADDAVAMARRLSDRRVLVSTLSSWFLATVQCNSTPAERDTAVEEMLAIAEEMGDPELEIQARFHEGTVALETSNGDRLRHAAHRIVRLADELRQPYYRWLAAGVRSSVALLDGDLDLAEELAHEALRAGQAADEPGAYEGTGVQLVVNALENDEFWRYNGMYALMATRYPAYTQALTFSVVSAAGRGRVEEARGLLRKLADQPLHRDASYLGFLANVSMWSAALGEEHMERWVMERWAEVDEVTPTLGVPIAPFGLTHGYFVGVVLIEVGEHDKAVERLTTAVEEVRRLGSPYGEGLSAAELARALLLRGDDGDHQRAAEWLATADDCATRCHASALLRRIGEVRENPGRPNNWNMPEHEHETRPTLRARAERLMTTAVSGAVGRWVRDRSDAEIERRWGTARVQRAVFNAMARAVTADTAGNLKGDIVVELSRDSATGTFAEPDTWTVHIDGDDTTANQGPSPDPLLTLRLSIADFVRLLGGELGSWDALASRRMRMEGAMTVAMRLEDLFRDVLDVASDEVAD
jgi:class 3 adenylate cyclase/tetratricopeptide (TPR) repeat protein/putative sterol carrier protein